MVIVGICVLFFFLKGNMSDVLALSIMFAIDFWQDAFHSLHNFKVTFF